MTPVFDIWSIIIYALIILGFILGIIKGFAKQLKGFFGLAGAVAVAFLLGKLIYTILKATVVSTTINQAFETLFLNNGAPFTTVLTEATFGDTLTAAISYYKMPTFISNLIAKQFTWNAAYEGSSIGVVVGDAVGLLVLKSAIYIILFILALVFLKVIYAKIRSIAKFKGISPLDHILGFAFGIFKYLLIICFVFWGAKVLTAGSETVASSIGKFLPTDPGEGYFSMSYYLYTHNPLMSLLVNI